MENIFFKSFISQQPIHCRAFHGMLYLLGSHYCCVAAATAVASVTAVNLQFKQQICTVVLSDSTVLAPVFKVHVWTYLATQGSFQR